MYQSVLQLKHEREILTAQASLCRRWSAGSRTYRDSPKWHSITLQWILQVSHHFLPHKPVERMYNIQDNLHHHKKHKYQPVMHMQPCNFNSMWFNCVRTQLNFWHLLLQRISKVPRLEQLVFRIIWHGMHIINEPETSSKIEKEKLLLKECQKSNEGINRGIKCKPHKSTLEQKNFSGSTLHVKVKLLVLFRNWRHLFHS